MRILKALITLSLFANLAFAGSGQVPGASSILGGNLVRSTAGIVMNANHLASFNETQEFKDRIQSVCGSLQQVEARPELDSQASIPIPLCGNEPTQNQQVDVVTAVLPASRCSRPPSFDRETESLNYCGCLRMSFLGPQAQNNDLSSEVRQAYQNLTSSAPRNKEIKVDIVSGMLNVYVNNVLRQYSNYRAIYGEDSFDLPTSCRPAQMISALQDASRGFASGEINPTNCNGANCAQAPEIASKAIRDLFKIGTEEELDQAVLNSTNSRLVNFTNSLGGDESSCVRSASTENLLTLIPHASDTVGKGVLTTALDSSIAELRSAKDLIGNCQESNLTHFDALVNGFTSNENISFIRSFDIVTRLNGSIASQFYRSKNMSKSSTTAAQKRAACLQIKKVVSSSLEFYKETKEVNSSSSSTSEKLLKLDNAYRNLINDTKLSQDQLAESSEFLKVRFEKDCNNFLTDVSLLACSDTNVLQSDILRIARNVGNRLRTVAHTPLAEMSVYGGPAIFLNVSEMSASFSDCNLVSSVDCKAQDLVQCDTVSPQSNARPRTTIAPSLSFLSSASVRRSLANNSPFSAEGFEVKRRSAVGSYCAGFGAYLRSLPECKDVPGSKMESCLRTKFYSNSDVPAENEAAAQRLQQAITGFSNRPGIPEDLKDLLVSVVSIAKPHGSLGEDHVIEELAIGNSETRNANADIRNGRVSKSDLYNLASVLGGVGDGSSSKSSTFESITSPMFNAETVQAFATQARVSPATSGAVMSRFIAAVPPMQNMPQQQQRQQMDQALERSVNQTVAELENKAAGTTSASERQKYLDEIAELRRLMADQTARNDLITQQMAAMNQAPAEETQAAPTKRKRAPASVANTSPESPEVQSTGFQTGGGRSSGASASSGSVGGSQDLAGAQGFGGGAAAAGRSVSSVSEARDAAPNDSSLRLVVGGAGGQVIPAAQVITISVPSGDEQALKDAILGQRERLNVGEDGYAVVEVIDPASGRASLVRVKIENDNVIVQNFTAEQLRNTTIVSEANPQPRQIRYSLQAMTNLLNQASGGSN
jgi:hypothetical protein